MSYFLGSRNELLEQYEDHLRGELGATELSFRTPSWKPRYEAPHPSQTKNKVGWSCQRFVVNDAEVRERLLQLCWQCGWDATEEDTRQVAVWMRNDVSDELVKLINLGLWTEVRSVLLRQSPVMSRR